MGLGLQAPATPSEERFPLPPARLSPHFEVEAPALQGIAGKVGGQNTRLRLPLDHGPIPKATLQGFEESGVNPDEVPYLDRAREKQRLKAAAEQEAARAANPEAFEDTKREREKRRREEERLAAEKAKSEKRLTAAKRRQAEAREDFDDINDDYRALKKLKKGKITEEEFDFELGFEQPEGGGGRDRDRDRAEPKRKGPAAGQLHGAARKAAEKKPKPAKPRHLKNSKAKGGGRGAKAMKKKAKAKR